MSQVVAELGIEAAARRQGYAPHHEQGVTIRTGVGHHIGSEIARGAGAVVHDDVLAQTFRKLGPDYARDVIIHDTGRETEDQSDRLVRIGAGIRTRDPGSAARISQERRAKQSFPHGVFRE